MYDDLIKRLRNRRICIQQLGTLNDYPLLGEAADAIDELSRDLDSMNEANIALYGALPKWIPVTEWLPEAERKSYWVCTDTGYQCECRWTNNRFGIGELDKWGWSIFDIPQYQKVVAWMPLPKPYEPPKEE